MTATATAIIATAPTGPFEAFGLSDQGPREYQEDRFTAAPHVLGVYDGMGGHGNGDTAAEICSDVFGNGFTDPREPLAAAHDTILDRFGHQYRLPGATVAAISPLGEDEYSIGWAGDVRIYAVQPNQQIELLTYDHTLAGVRWYYGGRSMDDLDALAADKNNAVLGCVGGTKTSITNQSETKSVRLKPGTILIIMSDGAWSALQTSVIENLAWTGGSPEAVTRMAMDFAVKNGLKDNATIVTGFIRA